ncbi:MAG TPA: hypothetical protein VHC23_11600 [Jatrophihabitans sp.]|nr:hypothetical protein [Jatrophihabitans sp.]
MILTFPTDRIVGTLEWAAAWNPDTGPVLATGEIEVPDGAAVSLRVWPTAGSRPSGGGSWEVLPDDSGRPIDLAFLRELPPEGVEGLTLDRQVVVGSLPAIAHLASGLRSLYLPWCGFGDDVLPSVARLTGLTYLQTFGNRFTDRGVQQLDTLRELESLYLEEETLTVAAFDFAVRRPRLKRLGLQDVPVGKEELEALRRRLPGVDIG